MLRAHEALREIAIDTLRNKDTLGTIGIFNTAALLEILVRCEAYYVNRGTCF